MSNLSITSSSLPPVASVNLSSVGKQFGQTAEMQQACEKGDLSEIIKLVELGADPNQKINITKPVLKQISYNSCKTYALMWLSDEFESQDIETIDNGQRDEDLKIKLPAGKFDDDLIAMTQLRLNGENQAHIQVIHDRYEKNGYITLADIIEIMQMEGLELAFSAEGPISVEDVKVSPLLFALMRSDFDSAEKLVKLGANPDFRKEYVGLVSLADQGLDMFALPFGIGDPDDELIAFFERHNVDMETVEEEFEESV